MQSSKLLRKILRQYMREVETYGEKGTRRHIDHSSVGNKASGKIDTGKFLAKLVGTLIFTSWITGLYQLESGKTLSEEADAKQEDYEGCEKRFSHCMIKKLLSLVKTARKTENS